MTLRRHGADQITLSLHHSITLCTASFAVRVINTTNLASHLFNIQRSHLNRRCNHFLRAHTRRHNRLRRFRIGHKLLLVLFAERKLDRVGRRFGAEVIHARFQAFLPGVEVHRREFRKRRRFHEHVEALALADVYAAICTHVNDDPLA